MKIFLGLNIIFVEVLSSSGIVHLDTCCRTRLLVQGCSVTEWYLTDENRFKNSVAEVMNYHCSSQPSDCGLEIWNENCSYTGQSIQTMPNFPVILENCILELRIFVPQSHCCHSVLDQDLRILKKQHLTNILREEKKLIEELSLVQIIYIEELLSTSETVLRQWFLQLSMACFLLLVLLVIYVKKRSEERLVVSEFFRRTVTRSRKNLEALQRNRNYPNERGHSARGPRPRNIPTSTARRKSTSARKLVLEDLEVSPRVSPKKIPANMVRRISVPLHVLQEDREARFLNNAEARWRRTQRMTQAASAPQPQRRVMVPWMWFAGKKQNPPTTS